MAVESVARRREAIISVHAGLKLAHEISLVYSMSFGIPFFCQSMIFFQCKDLFIGVIK